MVLAVVIAGGFVLACLAQSAWTRSERRLRAARRMRGFPMDTTHGPNGRGQME
jgi:hypothetical protein